MQTLKLFSLLLMISILVSFSSGCEHHSHEEDGCLITNSNSVPSTSTGDTSSSSTTSSTSTTGQDNSGDNGGSGGNNPPPPPPPVTASSVFVHNSSSQPNPISLTGTGVQNPGGRTIGTGAGADVTWNRTGNASSTFVFDPGFGGPLSSLTIRGGADVFITIVNSSSDPGTFEAIVE